MSKQAYKQRILEEWISLWFFERMKSYKRTQQEPKNYRSKQNEMESYKKKK